MSDQRRLRSNATALTTEQKKKLAKEAGITENMDQYEAGEKMKKALDEKLRKDYESNPSQQRRSLKTFGDDYNKDLVMPKFFDVKKEYVSKGEKVKMKILNKF